MPLPTFKSTLFLLSRLSDACCTFFLSTPSPAFIPLKIIMDFWYHDHLFPWTNEVHEVHITVGSWPTTAPPPNSWITYQITINLPFPFAISISPTNLPPEKAFPVPSPLYSFLVHHLLFHLFSVLVNIYLVEVQP